MEFDIKQIQMSLREKYKHLNAEVIPGQTLFVGSSLQELFPINELSQNKGIKKIIYNRGIGGYTTIDLLDSMEICIFDLKPSKIFINIGSNDIGDAAYKEEVLIENYRNILSQTKHRQPMTKVYVMAYYPVNEEADFGLTEEEKKSMFISRTNNAIKKANKAIEKMAKEFQYEYIDVNEGIKDEKGSLKKEFSVEGIHIWPNGYNVILDNLISHIES